MTRELAVHHYCRSRTARQRLSPRCYHAVFTIHINHSQCHCKDEDKPRGQIVPEDVMRGKRLAVVRRAPHAPRFSRTSLLSCCKRLTQKFHHTKKLANTTAGPRSHFPQRFNLASFTSRGPFGHYSTILFGPLCGFLASMRPIRSSRIGKRYQIEIPKI